MVSAHCQESIRIILMLFGYQGSNYYIQYEPGESSQLHVWWQFQTGGDLFGCH